jgi:hypothetical protein
MKHLPLFLAAILCLAPIAYSEEVKVSPPDADKTPTATPRTKMSAEELLTLLGLYEKFLPEAEKPALVMGQNRVQRVLQSLSTQYAPAQYAGEFEKNLPNRALYQAQIKCLKEEVDVLKKLNAALEKQLAECKPQP